MSFDLNKKVWHREEGDSSLTISSLKDDFSKSSKFKPLVASSLALLLGVGIVNAECVSSGDSPILCSGSDLGSTQKVETITNGTLKWVEANTSSSNYVKPTFEVTGGKTSTDIKDFTIMFGSTGESPSGALDVNKLTLTTKNDNYFSIVGGTKGVQLGDIADKGTLTIDFNGQNNKTFELDFSKATSDFSLIGNLEIRGSGGQAGNAFNAKLKSGIQGDITINSTIATSTFTIGEGFTDNSNHVKLDGSITANSGVNTFDFKANGEITGNITGSGIINLILADTKSLTLKGETNKISQLSIGSTKGTLVLNAGNSKANTTTISEITNGDKLTLQFDGTANKTLKLEGTNGIASAGKSGDGAYTLKSVNLGGTSTKNTIDITGITGSAKGLTIADTVIVESGKELTLRLKDQALLTAGINGDGIKNLVVVGSESGKSATLRNSGNELEFSSLTFEKGSKDQDIAAHLLTIKDSSFSSLVIQEGVEATLTLDGSTILTSSYIGKMSNTGGIFNVELKNNNVENNAILHLGDSNEKGDNSFRINSLKALGIGNVVDITNISGTNKILIITEKLDVAKDGNLTFILDDEELILLGGVDTTEKKGDVKLLIDASKDSDAKLRGKNLAFSNLAFSQSSTDNTRAQFTLRNDAVFDSITTNQSSSNKATSKFILDASANAVTATIGSIKGENLDVELKGSASGAEKIATLNITGGTNTINRIGVKNQGSLVVGNTATTITERVSLTESNGLNIEVKDKAALTLAKGIDSGDQAAANIVFLGGTQASAGGMNEATYATLILLGSDDSKISTISARGINNIFDLTRLASTNKTLAVTGAIKVGESGDLTFKLKDQTLVLQEGIAENLKGVNLEVISDANSGATLKGGVNLNFSTLTFGNTKDQKSNLTLLSSARFDNVKAEKAPKENEINTTTLTVDAMGAKGNVTATIGGIIGSNLDVVLKSGKEASGNAVTYTASLDIAGGANNIIKSVAIADDRSPGSLNITGGNTTIASAIDKTLTLNIKEGSLTLKDVKEVSIEQQASTNSKILDQVALGKESANNLAVLNIDITDGKPLKIASLSANGTNGVVNLSGQSQGGGLPVFKDKIFQTLIVGDIAKDSKPINFIVGAGFKDNTIKSDRIIIESSKQETNKTHYLGVVGDVSEFVGKTFTEKDGIALATVKQGDDEKGVVTLQATDSISGFSLITYDYDPVVTKQDATISDAQAQNTYITYFFKGARSQGATLATQQVTAAALGINYDLYLANLNSLNKRMGELRENHHSQGVWARIFTGKQTSKFVFENQSTYTTIQAGYDYAFGFNGANNYVGFALSYMNSNTNSKSILDQDRNTSIWRGIDKISSSGFEFAIYNAYVQDGASKESGWKNGLYSDSILKFSYITSKLDLLGQTDTYSTNNFAVTFSQELGYRFLFGSSKEIFIDPQVEVALGYLNQSDLKQKLGQATLEGIQDSIFTLRTRVGSSFGYDFKNFTQNKDLNAKAYLGAYFANDYISGGRVSLTDNFGTNVSMEPLKSTSRFVLNIGTNLKVKDNHRVYFDFEKSFGGKIITDYQVNLGYRYSFGASKYTPYNGVSTTEIDQVESIKEIAPSSGFYLQIFEKEKLSKKETNLLKKLKDDLRVQDRGDSKVYLIGPFSSKEEAQEKQSNFDGILKELNSSIIILEVK
ncbi:MULTISPECIES: autotransporter outer membrane beta-barrel domain-containing protein [unclassified Helicobacter]|uniref:autotransporter outer membrane beta-barrel domain-containing protein n=1 Tax=unclassified Helicobacter TaxID=2593540 RepID=UPI000CF15EA2|nr:MULTISPECIES: autotransporter outer membrane beta-barrel domain-containing protein [unclassified Helicobacter]